MKTPEDRSALPGELKSFHDIEGITPESSEIKNMMMASSSKYNDFVDEYNSFGIGFLEAFSHYAGSIGEAFDDVTYINELSDQQVQSDSDVVDFFLKSLFGELNDKHNQANRVARWYGMADAERQLWGESIKNDSGLIDNGVLSMSASEMVERTDELGDQLLERVEDLPDSYKEEIPDLTEVGSPKTYIGDRYRSLDLS